MEEGDYLRMDPACEVNEKGTREKNDGNEVIEEETSSTLDPDPNETSVTIQDVDRGSLKYVKTERDDPSWAAQEG